MEHSADLLEEAASLVAAVGTVPMTGATSESIMDDPFLDADTKTMLADRWGDRGEPDVTYKYDKGTSNDLPEDRIPKQPPMFIMGCDECGTILDDCEYSMYSEQTTLPGGAGQPMP